MWRCVCYSCMVTIVLWTLRTSVMGSRLLPYFIERSWSYSICWTNNMSISVPMLPRFEGNVRSHCLNPNVYSNCGYWSNCTVKAYTSLDESVLRHCCQGWRGTRLFCATADTGRNNYLILPWQYLCHAQPWLPIDYIIHSLVWNSFVWKYVCLAYCFVACHYSAVYMVMLPMLYAMHPLSRVTVDAILLATL